MYLAVMCYTVFCNNVTNIANHTINLLEWLAHPISHLIITLSMHIIGARSCHAHYILQCDFIEILYHL